MDENNDEDFLASGHGATDSIFDEKKFFAAPSFPGEVLDEVKRQIYERIERPLRQLEQGGYELLSRQQRERREKIAEEKSKEDMMIQKYLNDLLIKGDPREYQRTLLSIALSRNTIVNLPTGAGKTLIALLCIKEKHALGKGKKKTLFVVPSVALAIQQSFTLRSNLPNFKIETACYAATMSKKSRGTFADCDVLCATHGAILDLLMHWGDIFFLSCFNLIVIDECHYACGNHPYHQLMNKFYHTLSPSKRPHVLGLTASPVLNLKETHTDEQLMKMLENLETTLDATLVSASALTSDDSLGWHSRAFNEKQLEFRQCNKNRAIPSAKNLKILISRLRECKQLENLYEDLGPLVVQIYCQVLRRELSHNHFERESQFEFAETMDYLRRVEDFCSQEIRVLPAMGRTDKLLVLEQLVEEELIECNGRANATGLVFVDRRITAMALHCYFQWRQETSKYATNWLSAVEARHQIAVWETTRLHLRQTQNDDGVFDDSSDDPFCLSQKQQACFQHDNTTRRIVGPMQNKAAVKSVALVRNPTQIFNSLSMPQKYFSAVELRQQQHSWVHKEMKLQDTVKELHDGDTNLMFATSVVEEGIDVQSCSFVIAFDGISSVKSYIQMKGRARQKNAKFFVLYNPKNAVEKLDLNLAQAMDSRVQSLVREKAKESMKKSDNRCRIEGPSRGPFSRMSQEIAAIERGFYKAGEAMVDLQSAKSLLYRYFLSIPMDKYMRSRKDSLMACLPLFTNDQLELPSHLPPEVRTVVVPNKFKAASKKEKQNVLSLMACVRLHRHGLLNERLLPLSANDLNAKILNVMPFCDTTVRRQRRISWTMFDGENLQKIYVYPVKQVGCRFSLYEEKLNGMGHCLGIVTMEPIKSFFGPIPVSHKEFGNMQLSLRDPVSIVCSRGQRQLLQNLFDLLLNFRWGRRQGQQIYCDIRAVNECSNSVIPLYLIGILSKELTMDWGLMATLVQESQRSEEQRRCSLLLNDQSRPVLWPRLWIPSYSQSFMRYVVFKPTGRLCSAPFPFNNENVRTFQDYFKELYSVHVSDDEPLFEAQYMWTCHYGLSTSLEHSGTYFHGEMPSFVSVELPPSVCLEAPLANAHIALLTVFLPQLLYIFERHQTTEAFIQHAEETLPTLGSICRNLSHEQVSMALTAKSSNLSENYEKLEWLGDAVLKLLQTDSLVKSDCLKDCFHFLHEGNLSMLRDSMGTNVRLTEICVRLGLERYILAQPLSRGTWTPSPFQQMQKLNSVVSPQNLQTKCHADTLEALLGLIYIKSGYASCMKVGNELGLSLLWKDEIERKEKGKVNEVVNEDLLAIVQKCTGYEEFIHPQLFEEAFSHPTAMDSMVPSYQRLEWIGDAVACLCVRDWIFHHFESELGLKEMVLLEDAIVSNETFGWLSMKYGLPHLLNHRDPTLPGRIESYMSRLQAGNGLWNSDPPKTISDITESVLGAIHMDKNFKAGQAAALQMLDPVLQVVEEAIKENAIDLLFRFMQHPKRSLQEMAGEVLDLQCFQEAKSASHISDSSYIMLKGLCWNASKDGLFHVAAVKILGSTLVAVASESISISSTTAALLVTQALHDNLPLLQRIKKCQAHLARGSSLTSVMDRQEQHQDYQCQQFLEVHGATKSHTKDGDGGAVVDAMMYQQQEVWGGY